MNDFSKNLFKDFFRYPLRMYSCPCISILFSEIPTDIRSGIPLAILIWTSSGFTHEIYQNTYFETDPRAYSEIAPEIP